MNSSGASPGFFENIWLTYIEQPNLRQEEKWSDFQIVAIGSFCLKLFLIFGCATVPLTFHFFPALHKFKIQQKVYYDLSTFWKGYKSIIMTHAFGIGPLAFIISSLFKNPNFREIIPFAWDLMDPWYVLGARCFLGLIIEDIWHYHWHRLLHHPKVYNQIHKIHHYYSAPFAASAEYAHPIETMLLGIGFFLPVLFLTNHLIFLWTWLAVREIQTYEVHSGYDFPWNPTKLIPFYGGPRFHDYHHEQFNANYASSFTYLDRFFGTDAAYLRREKKRLAGGIPQLPYPHPYSAKPAATADAVDRSKGRSPRRPGRSTE
jgi:methylsterol monooxygenase